MRGICLSFFSLSIHTSLSVHSQQTWKVKSKFLKDFQDSECLWCGVWVKVTMRISIIKWIIITTAALKLHWGIFLHCPVQEDASKHLLTNLMGQHTLCEIIALYTNTYQPMKWIRINHMVERFQAPVSKRVMSHKKCVFTYSGNIPLVFM